MIYLPLDKLISQQDASTKSVGGTTQSATVAVAPEQIPTVEMRFSKDGRSRDSRDSRDREVR
jgi:membrane protease subunit HflK